MASIGKVTERPVTPPPMMSVADTLTTVKSNGHTKMHMTPSADDPVYKLATQRGFTFVKAQKDGGTVAYGYEHKDGRALLHLYGLGWQLRQPDGTEHGSKDFKVLQKTLGESRKAVMKAAKSAKIATTRRVQDEKTAARKTADKEKRRVIIADAPDPGVAVTVRLVQKLTDASFKLSALRGDKQYGARLKIAKSILGEEDVRVEDAGITALTKRLLTVVGAKDGTDFIAKCQMFIRRADSADKAVRTEDKETEKQWARATVTERTVPGKVGLHSTPQDAKASFLGATRKKSKKQRREELEQLKAEMEAKKKGKPLPPRKEELAEEAGVEKPGKLYEAATGCRLVDQDNPPLATLGEGEATILHTGSEGAAPYLTPEDVALLEHKDLGVVMLRLSKPGVYGGAPCVYNNGKEVSLGIISLENLAKWREIEKADVLMAARQFLQPIVPSVKVSDVAASHLTAVLHCKEIIPMADTKAKFAPPAKTEKKNAKATPKASKKSVAIGKQKGEHRTGGIATYEDQVRKLCGRKDGASSAEIKEATGVCKKSVVKLLVAIKAKKNDEGNWKV